MSHAEMTGGCACGAIRFKITAPFIATGACHCTDCQKASGGGPNYVGLAPKDAFVVTKGKAKLYVTKSDNGTDATRAFCPDCGTPLWRTAFKLLAAFWERPEHPRLHDARTVRTRHRCASWGQDPCRRPGHRP